MTLFNYKLWLVQSLGSLTLGGNNVPYSYGRFVGTDSQYVVGMMYETHGVKYADNVEVGTQWNIQLDVYSKIDNQPLIQDIHDKMLLAGATKDHILESVDPDGTLVTNMFFKLERNVS